MGIGGQLFKQYGEFVALSREGGTRIASPLESCPGTILTYNPRALQQVFGQSDVFYRFPLSGLFYRFRNRSPRHEVLEHFTTGLFNLNGVSHHAARQHLSPAFRQRVIATWRDDIVAVTEREFERWDVGKTLDLWPLAYHWSAKATSQALLGVEMNEHEISFVYDVLHRCGSPVAILLLLFPYNIPGLPFRKFLRDLEISDELALQFIERSQAQWRDSPSEGSDRLTLISLLLDAQSGQ
ncbi:MAG: hypothetical protein AAGA67_05155, partial [Cyanobacteria bacterium P01_F01_bin.153]